LSLRQVRSLFGDIGPPHGYELLKPFPLSDFPKLPPQPPWNRKKGFLELFWGRRPPPGVVDASFETKKRIVERGEKLQSRGESLRHEFETRHQNELTQLSAVRDACMAGEAQSISLLFSISHVMHRLPDSLQHAFEVDIDPVARVVLCTIGIPDFRSLNIVKKRGDSSAGRWVPISATERKYALEMILYSLSLRAAYLIARSDEGNWFDTIAINAKQNWIDPATGSPRSGIIASLQAAKEEISRLHLEQVGPKSVFSPSQRNFNAIS
jgi:hypothetical protein